MKKNHGQWRRFIAGILAVIVMVSVIPQQRKVQAAGIADVDQMIASVSSCLLKEDKNPDFDSTWNMMGLVRSGKATQAYKDMYYHNTIQYAADRGWKLHSAKYTEYSKMILALTALGKDARNIEGHNLLGDLSDLEDVSYQGFNGPVWALIALKSNPAYKIPLNGAAGKQTTEEGLIQVILEKQYKNGGWNLSCNETLFPTADSDMTGMAIQALSAYYGKREDVTKAVEKALNWLSANQFASGGFGTPDPSTKKMTETCESTVQVIVALSSLGIDCAKDSRFVKNGHSPLDGLAQYYLPEKGFQHVLNGGKNGMATEQGMYALAAYKRLVTGQTALYDMSEYKFPATAEQPTDQPGSSTEKPGQTTPGTSTEKPGQTTPGASTEKPGQTTPGTSTEKPGQTTPGNSTDKPNQNTQNPNTTKPDHTTGSATAAKLKLQVSKTSTSAIALKWNKITNAKGYVVENYNSSKKKYEKAAQLGAAKTGYTLKRVGGTKGKKLTSGTVYKLRVRAIISVNGKNTYKQTETVTTATKPDRVSLTKLSRKSSSKARITWKKVKRSSGYEIYMSAKKKSGYKKIKTITKNKTVSYTKTKLKKGRTYYVKVRAYRKVGSKKVYGDFSGVKSIRMK